MKSLIVMTSILFAISQGCSKQNTDQNFQDNKERKPANHYDANLDQPANKEAL